MFRYSEPLCWVDGVFLRSHHFQQQQEVFTTNLQSDRSLHLSYPYGVKVIDFNDDMLAEHILHLNRLKAILPDGTEICVPGNCDVASLEIDMSAYHSKNDIVVYLAVPQIAEGESNIEQEGDTRARYRTVEREHQDLCRGSYQQMLTHLRYQAFLTTQREECAGCSYMAIMHLKTKVDEQGKISLSAEADHFAPALCMDGNVQLKARVQAFLLYLTRLSESLYSSLRKEDMQQEAKLHLRLETQQKLAFINGSYVVLREQLAAPVTPLHLIYAELCRLMMQLVALKPLSDWPVPEIYQHEDCLMQFKQVIDAIYALTASDSNEWCCKIDLTYNESLQAWVGAIAPELISKTQQLFVAVDYQDNPRRIADVVELGDTFKLTPASMVNNRVRGVTLVENRIPSPLLPQATNRLWFSCPTLEKNNSWIDISEEGQCALAWSQAGLPGISTELYLILSSDK